MKMAFIGAGNMAGAIIRGMCRSSFAGSDITAYDIDTTKTAALAGECGITAAQSAEEAVAGADAVVLAVKPQMFGKVVPPLREMLQAGNTLLVSIAAGKTLADIEALAGETLPIIRVMPNICATVGASIAAYTGNAQTTTEHRELVKRIFDAVGQSMELEETYFSAFAAIAGCSPAFTLLYIESLAQAGVKYGIPKQKSLEIASQAVLGTARLLQETGEHPHVLMDAVCSPAGTTIEGVCALQREGFEAAVLAAVDASLQKDKKL